MENVACECVESKASPHLSTSRHKYRLWSWAILQCSKNTRLHKWTLLTLCIQAEMVFRNTYFKLQLQVVLYSEHGSWQTSSQAYPVTFISLELETPVLQLTFANAVNKFYDIDLVIAYK